MESTIETIDRSKEEEVVSGSVSFTATTTSPNDGSHQSSEEEDLSEFSTLNINREVKYIKV